MRTHILQQNITINNIRVFKRSTDISIINVRSRLFMEPYKTNANTLDQAALMQFIIFHEKSLISNIRISARPLATYTEAIGRQHLKRNKSP